MNPAPAEPKPFTLRKQRILKSLHSGMPDASPKGFVDSQILCLVNRLNEHDEIVTTSSCAGRVVLFLEGLKSRKQDAAVQYSSSPTDSGMNPMRMKGAGIGGKGEGGQWLFVSHEPLELSLFSLSEDGRPGELFTKIYDSKGIHWDIPVHAASPDDISDDTRFLHFKFEPMIIHLATADISIAHLILKAAFASGFRESGIMNPGTLKSPTIVAVRTTGLALDSIIGKYDTESEKVVHFVDEAHIRLLFCISEQRFRENRKRMDLFARNIEQFVFSRDEIPKEKWEDKVKRQQRKRMEGLRKREELLRLKITKGEVENMEPLEVDDPGDPNTTDSSVSFLSPKFQ